jgi:hypothetical protein
MPKGLKVGDRVAEGVVCKQNDDGYFIGRHAEEYEPLPELHSEHRFPNGRRAFLSHNQAPIKGENLHPYVAPKRDADTE